MMHVFTRLDDFLSAINLTFRTGDTIVMAGVATAWLVVVVSTCPCGLEVVRSVVVFMVFVITATALLICHVGGNTMYVGAAATKSCSLKTINWPYAGLREAIHCSDHRCSSHISPTEEFGCLVSRNDTTKVNAQSVLHFLCVKGHQ